MTENPLAYKDRWMREYGGTIDNVCSELNPLSLTNDDETAVLLLLTSDQFNKLLSAASTGAMLQWPDQQYEIIWSLLRGVECGMDFCERVASCIYYSEDVALALQYWALSQGLLTGSDTEVAAIGSSAVADAGGGCSVSDEYGLAYRVVYYLNQIAEDIFDVLDVFATQAELVSGLIQTVPVIGKYISAGLDIATFLLTYEHTVYTAAFTAASHTAVACAIFCAREPSSCVVTVDQMLSGLRTLLAGYEPPGAFSTLADFAAWLATLSLTGDNAIVAAVLLVIVELWSRGATWLNIPPFYLSLAGADYTPINPSGICTDCPASCGSWLNGEDNAEDWTILPISGTYAVYNGTDDRFEATYTGVYGSGKLGLIELDFSSHISQVKLLFSNQGSRGPGPLLVYVDEVAVINQMLIADGDSQIVIPLDVTPSSTVWIYWGCRTWGDDAGTFSYLRSIEICTS